VAGRAEFFSFWPVRSLPGSSQPAQNYFFSVRSHPRTSLLTQNYFLGRAAFSFAVRSHLRRLFDFLWRKESLQYTFSESCVRNLNFFGIFSLPFLAL
jgi:hypothetical protein